MGKIGTPRPQADEGEVPWWDLPLTRKVAHFEALIHEVSVSAAAVTQRPAFTSLMGGRRRRGRRRGQHQQHREIQTHDWIALREEEERKKKRMRRKRSRGKWAKVDPIQWPFDVKVAHFTDIALGQHLKEAVEEAWLVEMRTRAAAKREREACRRRRQPEAQPCTPASPEHSTTTSSNPSSSSSCSSDMDVSESNSAGEGPQQRVVQENGGDDFEEALEEEEGNEEENEEEEGNEEGGEEVQVAGSDYVGQLMRRSDLEKKKERRKRRRMHAEMRKKKEKELRKKKKEKKNEEEQTNKAKNEANRKTTTTTKWEEARGRVRREISKLWTNKHVKRGMVRFERHLADREVLGKECLDWQRRQCGELLPFFSHTSTALGNSATLVVVGGKDARGQGTAAVRLLDTATMEWSFPRVHGPAPAFLFGHAACRVGPSTLYLMGGYDQTGLCSHVYRLDLHDNNSEATWSVATTTPMTRVGHALVRRGSELLLFGGHNGKQWSNDLYALDTQRMTWRKVPTSGVPPSPRGFHTATIVGSSLVVFGGTNLQHTFSDTHVLDLEALVWSAFIPQPGFQPPPRHSHASARVGQAVFIAGGRGRDKGVVRDCWSFDVDAQKWTRMKETNGSSEEGPLGLSSHTLTRVGSTLLVVVGGKGAAALSGDVWAASTTRLPLKVAGLILDYDELELAEEVGRGSFAKVVRASLRGTECAVKKLRKAARRDEENELKHFKQEVGLLQRLDHPNVVKMIGVCTKPRCIVTEFMRGGSLYDFLRTRGSLLDDPALLASIALDVARGGRYLHQQRVIHRDIKSHNILLDQHLRAKIADLGVSRIATETSTMTCVGSAQWTAPEILRHRPYDQAVDVYSYGIVVWELLSGSQPYAHMGRLEAAVAVASEALRPEIPEHWPAEWAQLMARCWHESPQARPTFAQIVACLEQAAALP